LVPDEVDELADRGRGWQLLQHPGQGLGSLPRHRQHQALVHQEPEQQLQLVAMLTEVGVELVGGDVGLTEQDRVAAAAGDHAAQVPQ
jgi:hypothetical protein